MTRIEARNAKRGKGAKDMDENIKVKISTKLLNALLLAKWFQGIHYNNDLTIDLGYYHPCHNQFIYTEVKQCVHTFLGVQRYLLKVPVNSVKHSHQILLCFPKTKDFPLKNYMWGVISLDLIINDGPSNIVNLGIWELWEISKREEGVDATCYCLGEWKGTAVCRVTGWLTLVTSKFPSWP